MNAVNLLDFDLRAWPRTAWAKKFRATQLFAGSTRSAIGLSQMSDQSLRDKLAGRRSTACR